MRLAVLQMEARAGEVPANLERIDKAAGEAAARSADLLVAPELAVTGYGAAAAIRAGADADAPKRLRAIAERHRIGLVAGFAESADGGRYNSALVALPGQPATVCRKCHLYGDYERGLFRAGSAPSPCFALGAIKIGVAICYDIEFPEMARAHAGAGANLVVVPTALPKSDHAKFIAERVVPVRAFENQFFVAYANHTGGDLAFAYAGLSCIVAPDGADLARAPASGESLLIADIEPDRYASCRSANPYLADRRLAF